MSFDSNLRRTIYFASHRMAGDRVGAVYRHLSSIDSTSREEDIPRKMLAGMLAHCYRSVPFYRDLMGETEQELSPNPFDMLPMFPVLTKHDIRVNFSRLLSEDLHRRRWYYNTTGGSTGEPVTFVQDSEFSAWAKATLFLNLEWLGRRFGEPAIWVWGNERDVIRGSVGPKMTILNWLTGDKWFNAFSLTPSSIRELITWLNEDPPRILAGYAQSLYEVARFARRAGLDVRPQRIVMTSASTLFPFMRHLIGSVFQCDVTDKYGSREVANIAWECQAHTGLHVFPWSNHVEVLDDRGYALPPGETGNIVVTCLVNRAMPLIRYMTGDRGALATDTSPCACGRAGPRLSHIEGRIGESFRRRDGALIDGEYFTHLLYFRPWVEKFQVIQKGFDYVVVRVVASSPAPQGDLRDIEDKAKLALGSGCVTEFEFIEQIEPTASGKYAFTISELDGIDS